MKGKDKYILATICGAVVNIGISFIEMIDHPLASAFVFAMSGGWIWITWRAQFVAKATGKTVMEVIEEMKEDEEDGL